MTQTAADDTILSVDGLQKYFGGERQFPVGRSPLIRAVDGVSLQAKRGETSPSSASRVAGSRRWPD
jgi:ABC-type glutathione transport system ATPase component